MQTTTEHAWPSAAEADGQAFLKKLRTETAAGHEALEAHPYSQSIATAGVTMEAYTRYLHIMQQVVAGMEMALHPLLSDAVPDIDRRTKSHWMEDDLYYLRGGENPFPPFPIPQQAASLPFALGAFYVVEGSTLGGRVILKTIAPALQVSAAHGATYFSGYGMETGPLWQRFLQTLCRYAIANDCEEEIIAGAKNAFAGILDYFNSCQAHEAERHRQP